MTERVMDINAMPSYLIALYPSGLVKVREDNRVITIEPTEDRRVPNAETIAVIEEARAGINLHRCESFEQLIKELDED